MLSSVLGKAHPGVPGVALSLAWYPKAHQWSHWLPPATHDYSTERFFLFVCTQHPRELGYAVFAEVRLFTHVSLTPSGGGSAPSDHNTSLPAHLYAEDQSQGHSALVSLVQPPRCLLHAFLEAAVSGSQGPRVQGFWSERAVFTEPRAMDRMDGANTVVWPRRAEETRIVSVSVWPSDFQSQDWRQVLGYFGSRQTPISLALAQSPLCASLWGHRHAPHNNCANSRISLTIIKLSPNIDIHFRANHIPVPVQLWWPPLSHTLSLITTPQGGRIPLPQISFSSPPPQASSVTLHIPNTRPSHHRRLSVLSLLVRICHLELWCIRILPHPPNCISQHMPSPTTAALLSPETFPRPGLSSARPFSYPIFHSLHRRMKWWSQALLSLDICMESSDAQKHCQSPGVYRHPQGMCLSQDLSTLSAQNLSWDWQLSPASPNFPISSFLLLTPG